MNLNVALLLLSICALASFGKAEGSRDVSSFEIPAARNALSEEAAQVQAELSTLPDFSETRQIDAYGFHGEYLPVLEELPEVPRWTVSLEWGVVAKVHQVILVPAIDPRLGTVHGYGFPKRFRVLNVKPDGSTELIAEWMDEDCPDPAHVPFRIDISDLKCSSIRLDVYRGAQEGLREFCAFAEIFGVVEKEVWLPKWVQASPEFESRPYWSTDYLSDQKTGLGMPLGLRSDAGKQPEFSIEFDEDGPEFSVIEFDLGSVQKMGWLTLFPVESPSGSIVPGYGFPNEIQVAGVRPVEGKKAWKSLTKGAWSGGNPGDNAIRIPLFGFKGRWLRLKASQFSEHNGHKIFSLGEATISMRERICSIQTIRLDGFPQEAESLVGALTDGLVDGRPELQMLEWFSLIERQNALMVQLSEIQMTDATLQSRWEQVKHRAGIAAWILFVALLAWWIIRRTLMLKRLEMRIVEERHTTEIEQMKLRFFSHISHELRTPLTVIPAPIERAMKAVGEGKLQTYLGVALRNVHELQALVEQILDLRQIQDGQMSIQAVETDLEEEIFSIIDSVRPLAEAKGIELVFEPETVCAVMKTDSRALKRILGNLIANAIKFTPRDGRVTVAIALYGSSIKFTVKDTGAGIAAADLPNIFEQHYRGQFSSGVQTSGSGLGLALVQEVVGLLGGTVQVESPVVDGHGSKFTVILPCEYEMGHER